MYSSIVCDQSRDFYQKNMFHMSNKESPRLLNSAMKYLLERVSLLNRCSHSYFGRLLNFSSHQEFIQDEVSLLEVEDDVQLTHLKQNNRTAIGLDVHYT